MKITSPVYAQDKVSDILQSLDPEKTKTVALDSDLGTIGGILTALLPYLLIIAGLLLLVMLIMGGFKLLTSANNPDNAEAGKKQLTNAILGFIILFAAYWIAQIIQVLTGINFLKPTL